MIAAVYRLYAAIVVGCARRRLRRLLAALVHYRAGVSRDLRRAGKAALPDLDRERQALTQVYPTLRRCYRTLRDDQ